MVITAPLAQSERASIMEREIKYDRITKDFALYLDGRLVGYAGSYSEGERRLNELVHAALTH
jgi:hypothetical protein